MSFLGRLFGSSGAGKELVKGLAEGLDELSYSHEEKAADQAASTTEARKVLIEWMKNTQGQNLSRRVIAFGSCFVWVTHYLISEMLLIAHIWVDNEKLQTSAEIISANAGEMKPAVILILGYYFAAPHMGRIAEVAMSRMIKPK